MHSMTVCETYELHNNDTISVAPFLSLLGSPAGVIGMHAPTVHEASQVSSLEHKAQQLRYTQEIRF